MKMELNETFATTSFCFCVSSREYKEFNCWRLSSSIGDVSIIGSTKPLSWNNDEIFIYIYCSKEE